MLHNAQAKKKDLFLLEKTFKKLYIWKKCWLRFNLDPSCDVIFEKLSWL